MTEFETCKNIIARSQRFVLTTHVNPDADGLGSELALARYLQRKGKDVHILNHSSTPWNCEFLDSEQKIIQFNPERDAAFILNADAIVVLDTNSPDRLESLKPFVLQSSATKICIDHHLDKAEFANPYIIDEASAATGEILYRLFRFLDEKAIDKEIAVPLYAAIMTDTGSFRFPKTNSELHKIIAHLLEAGADPVEIYQQVYEQSSSNRVHLLGKALSTLEVVHDGKVACMTVTWEMFKETKTSEEDTDNFITHTMGIRGVQIGLLVTELADGVKISLRSKGDIPVHKLAQEFGGNGHKNAAGARVQQGTLSDVIQQVLERSKHYII
ncbi:MAG: bifunctional oligoribonuclease/PAP phosphatase NrnA [Ignavibacteriales bacterium]|nr:bifunctional oligoribonuclease/PAP phosphatase NrnA [Ignavibacteriales bacterium]